MKNLGAVLWDGNDDLDTYDDYAYDDDAHDDKVMPPVNFQFKVNNLTMYLKFMLLWPV